MLKNGATILSSVNPGDTIINVDDVSDFTTSSVANANIITFFKPNNVNLNQMIIFNTRVIAINSINNTLTIDSSPTFAFEKYSGIRMPGRNDVYTVSATENGGLLTQAYGNIANGTDGGAFVEFVSLEEKHGSGIIPKYTEFNTNTGINYYGTAFEFANFWFKNKGNNTNIFQLVAARKHKRGSFGVTMSSKNSSFIFINQINFTINNQAAIAETTIHEIAHQFEVTNTHVDRGVNIQNIENKDVCVMSYSRKRNDGNAKFDIDCLKDIRNATEKR